MTTVLCRDGIIIADSRTSFSRKFEDYSVKSAVMKESFLDDTRKVVKLDRKFYTLIKENDEVKKERVFAAASAGKSRLFGRLYKYLAENGTDSNISKAMQSFVNFGYFSDSLSGVILLTETKTLKIIFRPDKHEEKFRLEIIRKDHDKLIGVGTGWACAKSILKLVGEKLTLKECFIFASYMDPSSSCDYTMYDSKTKVYTKLTKTTDKEIKEIVQKVQSLVNFYTGKKVTKRLIKQEED